MKVLPPRTVLVVDDEEDVRSAISRLLGAAGHLRPEHARHVGDRVPQVRSRPASARAQDDADRRPEPRHGGSLHQRRRSVPLHPQALGQHQPAHHGAFRLRGHPARGGEPAAAGDRAQAARPTAPGASDRGRRGRHGPRRSRALRALTMPRLDAFIDVLFQKGADSLVLETGSVAILEGPGPALVPLIKRTLTSAHIVSAVAELMPAYAATSFTGKQDEEIAYEAPAGRVVVRFSANGDGVRAELQPAAHAERNERERNAASLAHAGVQSPKAPPAPAPRSPAPHPRPAIVVPPADPAEAMQSLLELCNSQGASDLHLTSGYVPALRVDGDVVSVEGWGEPPPEQVEKILW